MRTFKCQGGAFSPNFDAYASCAFTVCFLNYCLLLICFTHRCPSLSATLRTVPPHGPSSLTDRHRRPLRSVHLSFVFLFSPPFSLHKKGVSRAKNNTLAFEHIRPRSLLRTSGNIPTCHEIYIVLLRRFLVSL